MADGTEPRHKKYEANLQSSDPYEVLGLEAGSSTRVIKKAYFSLVRDYPPEDQPDAFKIIRSAYERLRDPTTKAELDLFRIQSPDEWQPRKRRRKFKLDFDANDAFRLLYMQGDLGRRDFREDFRPIKF